MVRGITCMHFRKILNVFFLVIFFHSTINVAVCKRHLEYVLHCEIWKLYKVSDIKISVLYMPIVQYSLKYIYIQ